MRTKRKKRRGPSRRRRTIRKPPPEPLEWWEEPWALPVLVLFGVVFFGDMAKQIIEDRKRGRVL